MEIDIKKLIELRKKSCFSVKHITELLGVNRSTLRLWERGIRNPSKKNIRKLAEIFKVKVSEISDLKDVRLNIADYTEDIEIDFMENNWLKLNQQSYAFYKNNEKSLINQIHEIYIAMSESKIIISALLNHIDLIFYVKSVDNTYVTANNNFLKAMKLKDCFNVIGKRDTDLMSMKDAQKNMLEDETVLNNRKKVVYDGFLFGSRRKKWAIVMKTPIVNEAGEVTGLVGSFLDITDRKIAEEKNDILLGALNHSNIVIGLFNADANSPKIVYLSNSIEKLYGYPKEEFLKKKKFFYYNCLHPADRELVNKTMEQKVDITTYTVRAITKSKDLKWIEGTVTDINYKGRNRKLIIHKDVTSNYLA